MEHTSTVFIADSAEDFCSGLTAALQRADGFRVLGTAGDGEQAIRMIEEKKPYILVLDPVSYTHLTLPTISHV